jgi:hypothetical protein
MSRLLNGGRSAGLSGLIAVLLTGLAASPALASSKVSTPAPDTSTCSDPQFSQPFLSASDANWYTLAPGQAVDNFTGGGWTLTGGAKIVTTRLPNGQTGSVLDLPAGAQAVSPSMCVTSDYPTARTVVQGASSSGVTFSVSYAGTKTADKAKKTGKIQTANSGWTLSDPFNIEPGTLPGWQLVQFTFSSKQGEPQLYNFYIDPRMHC